MIASTKIQNLNHHEQSCENRIKVEIVDTALGYGIYHAK